MKKLILIAFVMFGLMAEAQVSRIYTVDKTITDSKAYRKRVVADAGAIRTDNVEKAFRAMAIQNEIYENIQFAWFGESGYKHRIASATASFWSKLYSSKGTNDATQTTELNQPYLSGNIAPNERWCMKNTNAGTKLVTHSGISVSGTYTVTTVEQTELTGKYTITHTELTTGTLTTITPSGRLAAKIIRSTALTTAQKLAESNFFRSIYPEIETTKIGNQEWATSNLDMVATPMGNVIANVTDNATWASSTDIYNATAGTEYDKVKAAAMWSYYNNDAALGAIYGKLYNWYAAKLLQMDIDYYNAANPSTTWGYRVPTSTDFTTLQTTLGGSAIAGGKMKKEGLLYWQTPNTGADNSSGFSALPNGYRVSYFGVLTSYFLSWALNEITLTNSYRVQIENTSSSFSINTEPKYIGMSIRLIKN